MASGGRKAVLLADDDATTRFVLSRALDSLGLRVVTIDDGTDLPTLVAEQRFDLLVVDLYMPGINGFEILRQLRRRHPRLLPAPRTSPNVPVLIVSGEGQPASIANAKKLGAADFLVKPIDVDVFVEIVRKLLEKRPGRRPAVDD